MTGVMYQMIFICSFSDLVAVIVILIWCSVISYLEVQRPAPWRAGNHDPDKSTVFFFHPPSHSMAFDDKPPLPPQEQISKRELSFVVTKRRVPLARIACQLVLRLHV